MVDEADCGRSVIGVEYIEGALNAMFHHLRSEFTDPCLEKSTITFCQTYAVFQSEVWKLIKDSMFVSVVTVKLHLSPYLCLFQLSTSVPYIRR